MPHVQLLSSGSFVLVKPGAGALLARGASEQAPDEQQALWLPLPALRGDLPDWVRRWARILLDPSPA